VVLLYNLVTRSSFTSWRVLYTYMKVQDLLPPDDSPQASSAHKSPPFSAQQHHQLQAELKQMYVGITRAMCDLVWVEMDPVKAGPLRDLLVKQVGVPVT
jgi:hypothetical protein